MKLTTKTKQAIVAVILTILAGLGVTFTEETKELFQSLVVTEETTE